jgi:uncharacterized protein YecE (DUF72 family)
VGEVWIGTSGYVYPHWRRGIFYPAGLPQKQELEYYARHFPTVELNNPFYRLPERATFESWKKRAPAGFRFAVKASRYLTHLRKLKDCEEPLERFLDRARGLGKKLGPILFQLPPHWSPDVDRLRSFLHLLPKREFAFEFRDPGWLARPVFEALERYSAALCLPVGPNAPEAGEVVTADFTYVRMHAGSGQGGSFTDAEPRTWTAKVRKFLNRGTKVYVYFNNDQHGHAIRNAMKLAAAAPAA